MMDLKFRAFRAVNEPETCIKFVEEHRNVLKDYGITNITTNNTTWMHNPNTYCVIAETESGNKIMGGVRIEISDDDTFLPVELAIGKMDVAIYRIVKNFRLHGGIGEICALWNAKAISGMGVSMLLIRAGIAVSGQLQIETLISICADYTIKMFQRVGFKVDHSLGLNGEFAYPNKTYTARVLGIMNTMTLEACDEFDKERIESIRNNPLQTFAEAGTREKLDIKYNLIISK